MMNHIGRLVLISALAITGGHASDHYWGRGEIDLNKVPPEFDTSLSQSTGSSHDETFSELRTDSRSPGMLENQDDLQQHTQPLRSSLNPTSSSPEIANDGSYPFVQGQLTHSVHEQYKAHPQWNSRYTFPQPYLTPGIENVPNHSYGGVVIDEGNSDVPSHSHALLDHQDNQGETPDEHDEESPFIFTKKLLRKKFVGFQEGYEPYQKYYLDRLQSRSDPITFSQSELLDFSVKLLCNQSEGAKRKLKDKANVEQQSSTNPPSRAKNMRDKFLQHSWNLLRDQHDHRSTLVTFLFHKYNFDVVEYTKEALKKDNYWNKRVEQLFAVYLFYVEMINQLVPAEIQPTMNDTCGEFIKATKLYFTNIQQRPSNGSAVLSPVVWDILGQWMLHARPSLFDQVKFTKEKFGTHVQEIAMQVKYFFNINFSLSYPHLIERLEEYNRFHCVPLIYFAAHVR